MLKYLSFLVNLALGRTMNGRGKAFNSTQLGHAAIVQRWNCLTR